MDRYPDGITGQRLVQKNVPQYFPDWITRAEVKKQGGVVRHVICDKPATWCTWPIRPASNCTCSCSRSGRAVTGPTSLSSTSTRRTKPGSSLARRRRARPQGDPRGDLGLATFVKTTGGKGLHVHVPLRPEADFDTVRGFAREVASPAGQPVPRWLTVEPRKEQRGHRLYLDIMRNAYAQTVVAPYSVRGPAARPGRDPGELGRGGRPGARRREFHAARHAGPAGPAGQGRATRGPGWPGTARG